jgi:hypothetical protein
MIRRWLHRRRVPALNRQALAEMRAGDFELAEMLFRHITTLVPGAWQPWLNLGNCVGNRGRYREALRYYFHAHTLAPLEHSPLVNASYAHLTLGEYREGFALYEERWRDPVMRERTSVAGGLSGLSDADVHAKRWDGVPRDGHTLLVFSEQGSGDVIQMLRFHRQLLRLGMRVVYRVPDSLYRLAKYNLGGADVCMTSERVPPHDWHVPFLSLPFHLGIARPTDIDGAAYLTAPIDRTVHELPGIKIGVVWRGNPKHPGDAKRSMDITALAPLFDLPGITWVSLQIGEQADDAEIYGLHRQTMRDFSDTARVISALDAVVAVDTSTAHLAGALGVLTCLMIPRAADWRWGVGGHRTPWYTSMSLQRQPRPGDWASVVKSVRLALQSDEFQRSAERLRAYADHAS